MISFVTFIDAPEQLELIVDDKGIDELIDYLNYIKKDKDHMHLILGNELEEVPIYGERKGKTIIAKHVRLEYFDDNPKK